MCGPDSTDRLLCCMQNLTLMAISLVIAFIRGWMLTLIFLSTFPLMIAAQYFQVQFIAGVGADTNKVFMSLM